MCSFFLCVLGSTCRGIGLAWFPWAGQLTPHLQCQGGALLWRGGVSTGADCDHSALLPPSLVPGSLLGWEDPTLGHRTNSAQGQSLLH